MTLTKTLLITLFASSIFFSCSENGTTEETETTQGEENMGGEGNGEEVDKTECGEEGLEGGGSTEGEGEDGNTGGEGNGEDGSTGGEGNSEGGSTGGEGNGEGGSTGGEGDGEGGSTEGEGNGEGVSTGGEGNGEGGNTGGETPTNGDIVLADNLVIDKSKEFVNFKLSNSEYQQYIVREANVRDITKEIYNHFNDDFDLIVILGTEIEHPAGQPAGFYSTAKNGIEGIGASPFNGTERFGSDGKLNGVLFMPRVRSVSNGPFLHEIAHIWGNKGFIPTTVGGHWGFASTGGQLGGFDTLTDEGNNTYKGTTRGRSFGGNANGGNGLPYSNTELYVMGLIPENELESIQVAVNPVSTGTFGEFTADEIKTYTREELIDMNGKRIPSFENAQKEFKTLTVILTPEDSLEEADKDDIVNRLEDFFKKDNPRFSSFNFWTATGERGSMSNEINTSSIK